MGSLRSHVSMRMCVMCQLPVRLVGVECHLAAILGFWGHLVLGAGLGGRLGWFGPMYFRGVYFGFSMTSRPK